MIDVKETNFQKLKRFTFAYIKSMRLYYSFITGIAGWIGVSFYFWLKVARFHQPITQNNYISGGIALLILFSSWGVNQIFNDWLGLPEDRVNAPHRPMVSGELNINAALFLSSSLMAGATVVAYFLNPWSTIPLILGFLMNFLYNYSKAWGLWANVIFGFMIANCTVFGFLASGPLFNEPLFTANRVSLILLIALMNGLMTYYTYFKDYVGDKEAGKDTFIVRHGLETARKVGVFASFLPLILFIIVRYAGYFTFEISGYFIYCGLMTVFIQAWTGIRFYNHPFGARAYFSNATNFRACACGQVTIIALFNGMLALYLYSITYVFIGFLFGLYDDDKG